jgi:hypothetical protein
VWTGFVHEAVQWPICMNAMLNFRFNKTEEILGQLNNSQLSRKIMCNRVKLVALLVKVS